jgi:hypothetical protein
MIILLSLKMLRYILFAAILVFAQANWMREDEMIKPEPESQLVTISLYNLTNNRPENVGSNYSEWGSGINDTMKSSIIKLINQGQAYHG